MSWSDLGAELARAGAAIAKAATPDPEIREAGAKRKWFARLVASICALDDANPKRMARLAGQATGCAEALKSLGVDVTPNLKALAASLKASRKPEGKRDAAQLLAWVGAHP